MEGAAERGLWLSLEECKALFSRLKGQESLLPSLERELLLRIEEGLYQQLSIQEVEALQGFSPGGFR